MSEIKKPVPVEIRHCQTIGEYNKQLREESKQYKFRLDSWSNNDDVYISSSLPICLEPEQLYVITSWNSNHYIQGISSKSFKVYEHYGDPFTIGKDYLLILPCY